MGLSRADKVMSLGRSSPGYTLGAEAELYDLRLYVHPSGHPLSAAEIRAVAEGVTSGISDETKCLPRGSTRFRDDSWSDLHGHDCTWYAETRVTSPKICEFSSAAAHCPVACRSRQECYPGNITATKAYYVWVTMMSMRGGGPTLCLGTDLGTKTQVVDACRDWTETARFGVWWDAGEGEGAWGVYREWAKQAGDLRSCDDLAAAVDDYCSFDSAPVREFTAASQINGGDFTVTFWVKPSSQQSPDPLTKRFEPSLGFLASLSPPRHNLIVGRFDNASVGGEAVVMDGCDASWTSRWSLISISRSNAKGVTTLVVSGASVSEQSEAAHGVCPFEAAALFQALEFDRPLLISPITLVPEALPVGKMQDLFYASRKHMAYRTGPAITPKVDIEKADYGQRTMLLSAPVVWQSRRLPTTDCKTKLSGTFIKEQHAKATESFCTGQFSCPSGKP
ncbi:hypothetical protein T484DRAFT_1778766 [Baffinella frigidus]|nr:hypothetical protein T484DRAFT_1778766 [Cryptophyta sp. CCMP2293]